MATNYNYPDPADIEAQAQYRPGAASNIFNVLTGGLAGQITGSTQRAQEAARARQALLQEEFGKRDEQRMLDRQLMINALQQGIEAPTGATLEEKMADFRNKSLRRQIAATEGKLFGYGQSMGPMQSQADPAFNIAAGQAQAELAQQGAGLKQRRDIAAEENRQFLEGRGISIPDGATAGQLEALRRTEDIKMQSAIPFEQRGDISRAALRNMQSKGFYPSPIDVSKFSAAQAIAEEEPVSKQYAESKRVFAFQEREKQDQNSIREFMQEARKETPDQSKLQEMFYALPLDAQKDARNRDIAGVTSVATPKEREQLTKYTGLLSKAQTLAGNISELAKSDDLSKVSQQNFNGFTSWLRGVSNKYGSEDPKVALLNDVVQQFEQVVAGTRKDLFGASLTGNELVSARSQFGDPNSANFLPRMIGFLDGVFSRDVVQEDFKSFGIQVPESLEKRTQEARNSWLKTRESLNFGGKQGTSKNKDSRIQDLRGELNALRSALTNAPSTTR
jgi:hypothetical protein